MNRIRLKVLSGLVVLGGLGASSASAQAPVGGTTSAPRSMAPAAGYYSNGYYYTLQPAPGFATGPRYYASAPAYRAPVPGYRTYSGRVNPDPTGRGIPLAKPWLRPLR